MQHGTAAQSSHTFAGMTGTFTMTKKKIQQDHLRGYLHNSNTITKSMQFTKFTQVCKADIISFSQY